MGITFLVCNCYRPISLLCVPFKILERLIYAPVKPIINPLLLREQAGFYRWRLTLDHVTLLNREIEDNFSAKKPALCLSISQQPTILYDMALYGMAQSYMLYGMALYCRHRSLTCKLLRLLLPDRHIVTLIMELVCNRSFMPIMDGGKQSRLRRLENGVHGNQSWLFWNQSLLYIYILYMICQ